MVYLTIVEKPQGPSSQSNPSRDPDVTSLLNLDYLGVIHRLDRLVGGVMVYAKTKQANSFLSKGVSTGGFYEECLAIVAGKAERSNTEIKDYLKKMQVQALVELRVRLLLELKSD